MDGQMIHERRLMHLRMNQIWKRVKALSGDDGFNHLEQKGWNWI